VSSGLNCIVTLPIGHYFQARRLLLYSGFELSEPLLKRFPPEENASTDSDRWKVWNAPNFAIDDVAKMRSRTPDKRGRLPRAKFKTEGTTPLLNSAAGAPRSLGRVECAVIGGTADADIPFSGYALCLKCVGRSGIGAAYAR
jgi:hypothetical protein